MILSLVELGTGVFALVSATRRFGHSNVGLIIDADGLTVIDTTATPQAAQRAKDTVLGLTAQLNLPIKRVVLTSSRIYSCGGGNVFWASGFYGSEATSDQLDTTPNPLAFRRLLPEFAFAYDDEFSTRPVTHVVSEDAWLTPAGAAVLLPGESVGNLAVQVPGAAVVFAGAEGAAAS